jgi:hypothetical protein
VKPAPRKVQGASRDNLNALAPTTSLPAQAPRIDVRTQPAPSGVRAQAPPIHARRQPSKAGEKCMYSNGAATEQCTFVGIAKDSRAVVITDDGKIK